MNYRSSASLLATFAVALLATTAFAQGPTAQSGAMMADNSTNPAASGTAPAAAAAAQNAASPLSFQIGNFSFTPGGFLDFTSVWRSTDVGSGIGTNFASIPYSNTPAGRVGEFRMSAQNSRLSLKVAGKHGDMDITGYFEGDFLGNQPTNIAVTSNSATFRMRIYMADIKDGNWEVVAGQTWSLLTPNRFQTSPMPGDVFYSQDMDTNYQVGLTWARQPQLRLIYHVSPNVTAAVSAEQPEQYVGGGSGSASIILPGGSSGVYSGQVDSGATSYSSPGFSPDIVGKLAFDSGNAAGQGIHLELAGLESTYRIYTPSTNTTDRVASGGFSANAIANVTPGFRIVATDFISDGGGRYFFGTAPDFVIRQNGVVSPVHASGGILGFEAPVTSTYMFYGYYGGEWIARDYDASASIITGSGATTPVGYGFVNSANSNNKSIQEGTFGIIDTFFKSANDGTLQLITQGSYLTRAPWYIASGAPKNAHAGMIFVDLRYVLP